MNHLTRPGDIVNCSPISTLETPNKMVKIFKGDIDLGTNRKIDFDELGPICAIVRFGRLDVMQYPNDILLEQNKVIPVYLTHRKRHSNHLIKQQDH